MYDNNNYNNFNGTSCGEPPVNNQNENQGFNDNQNYNNNQGFNPDYSVGSNNQSYGNDPYGDSESYRERHSFFENGQQNVAPNYNETVNSYEWGTAPNNGQNNPSNFTHKKVKKEKKPVTRSTVAIALVACFLIASVFGVGGGVGTYYLLANKNSTTTGLNLTKNSSTGGTDSTNGTALSTKDITSKGLIGNFVFPDSDTLDITVDVTLTRSHRKSIKIKDGFYRRYVDQAASFDYIKYGSEDTYDLTFRIVRFPISEDTYECLVTNLPEKNFPVEKLKEIYNSRWGIESSFRKLKYTIGLSHYHSYKPDFIKQEIWAKFIAYNATELLVAHTVVVHGKRKYSYKVNFTLAAHICRIYLRLHTETDSINVMALLQKELVPIRCDRQFPRLKTAHFRKPKYLIYRVS